jgi:hypothetical protein
MSDIDTMTQLCTAAQAVPDAQTQTGAPLWDVPAKPGNATAFTVQIDPNAGFWSVTDGSGYVVERGQGSPSLYAAMRRKQMIV